MFASSRNARSGPIAARTSPHETDVVLDRTHGDLALEHRASRAPPAMRAQSAATSAGDSSSPGR